MKRSSRPRKTANLSEPVLHLLNMYALAASTAGVGILALTQPAGARIVYTPTHVTIPYPSVVGLDLNNDGINDFKFYNTYQYYEHSHVIRLAISPKVGNAIVGRRQTSGFGGFSASALGAGKRIGRRLQFCSAPL